MVLDTVWDTAFDANEFVQVITQWLGAQPSAVLPDGLSVEMAKDLQQGWAAPGTGNNVYQGWKDRLWADGKADWARRNRERRWRGEPERVFEPNVSPMGSGSDYTAFLADIVPESRREGSIVDPEGREIGRHAGVAGFTVGQRKGLGLSAARPHR